MLSLRLEEAQNEAQAYLKDNGNPKTSEVVSRLYPVILECVEAWELKNIPPDVSLENLPGTPKIASAQFIAWLIKEITAIFADDGLDTDPNDLPPVP